MIINPISKGGKGLLPEIIVTAPSGSTLDLMQGSVVLQTYTLSSTETQHTFTVKNTGTYTVRGTSGSDTASVEVVVDAIGQFSCTISYFSGLKLYWYGDECADVTGGWNSVALYGADSTVLTYKNDTSLQLRATGSGSNGINGRWSKRGFASANKIPLSKYSSLNIDFNLSKDIASDSVNTNFTISVASSTSDNLNGTDITNSVKKVIIKYTISGTLSLDISDLTSELYVIANVATGYQGTDVSMYINKMWLE